MTRLFEAKPFIIAEVGSNWTTLPECLASIAAAKRVGADAVKFQLFTHASLYGFSDKPFTLKSASAILKASYGDKPTEPGHLPQAWLPKLKSMADEQGIEFMCTAFSPELVEVVDPFVKVHKIASSDLKYPQLLEAAKATGKPTLLSTGASSKGDVFRALEILGDAEVVLLYCNAAYPSRQHNLFQIDQLKQLGRPVGISDHSLDVIYAPVSAVRHFGAVVIEKHYTAFPSLETPDRPHSLTDDEFRIMLMNVKGWADTSDFQPSREERAMFLRHNRRLIATQDIPAGQILTFGENFGAYRSLEDEGKGSSPFDWEQFEGRTARLAISRGKGISMGDLE